MSDVRISDDYYHLVYDPLLHGYSDGYFKTASGTPSISTNVLRFNAASAYTTGQFMFGEYEFKVKVPSTPVGASLIAGTAGTTAITDWDQITSGEFAVTVDGNAYNVTGINFSGGTYTPAFLTGGNSATSTIDTWAAVTNGGFRISIDGTLRSVTGINFKTAFPYTPAYLTGGNSATSTIATWAAVTDGSFAITVDGVSHNVTGIDFSNVAAYTPAFLTGGSGATAVPATWAAVTDGEFTISINGASHDITGIDFTGATTMAGVASIIQTKLRAATSGLETVVWSTDHFVVSSVNTTSSSAITVTSAVSGGGGTDISGAGATAFMDSDTGNGVVTNKVSLMTMNQVASTIQTALRAATSGLETVVWSTNHFVVSSVNTTVDSAITVLSAAGSGTDISGAGGTDFMDADTGHGNVTNHVTTKTLTDVAALIQSSLRAVTGSTETVIWSTNHFKISSVNTTSISAVSVTTAAVSGTDLSGAGATDFMDADTGHGVATARAMSDQMVFVASVIQSKLQAATGGLDTVTWTTDHFVFATDTSVSGVSSISVLSAVSGGSGTDISGAGYINGLFGTGTLTTGTVKDFGLKIPAMGSTNYILFSVVGDKLVCKVCDAAGNIDYAVVTWLAAWTNTDTIFTFHWVADMVRFYVNKAEIARLSASVTRDVSLPVYINNTNSDNMDVSYVYIKGARKHSYDLSAPLVTTSTPSTLLGGSKTVATSGTAVALGTSTPIKQVYIRAKSGNTGDIYVGDSSVDASTSKQMILVADASATLQISNLATVYIDAEVNGEGVDYLATL